MKHDNKWLAILLALTLAAGLLSGCQFHPNDKRLTIEVPKGIDLSIEQWEDAYG